MRYRCSRFSRKTPPGVITSRYYVPVLYISTPVGSSIIRMKETMNVNYSLFEPLGLAGAGVVQAHLVGAGVAEQVAGKT